MCLVEVLWSVLFTKQKPNSVFLFLCFFKTDEWQDVQWFQCWYQFTSNVIYYYNVKSSAFSTHKTHWKTMMMMEFGQIVKSPTKIWTLIVFMITEYRDLWRLVHYFCGKSTIKASQQRFFSPQYRIMIFPIEHASDGSVIEMRFQSEGNWWWLLLCPLTIYVSNGTITLS